MGTSASGSRSDLLPATSQEGARGRTGAQAAATRRQDEPWNRRAAGFQN
jgi:hypothetical protein